MSDTKTQKIIIHINEERCKGCNYCIEFCPQKVLYQSEKTNAKGYRVVGVSNNEKCTGCGLCTMFCPEFAIHIEGKKGKV